ncbi:Oidioi.mRNA.OKI2018_I69.XSR.g14441.t1.cds [Oikopleura dioica]|uniref:Oidioi.mRNA.OKI2018_I69.XSR.g14441.t1.cds n=1 Tax=Oikopleura dioica TaxID=34765 RepID=A0ABN7S9T0_OIKDI|nr:Oidioi.mRNA.OKI2018_I69.XSR.g14441.t1.cds [Oikopleura dioica]
MMKKVLLFPILLRTLVEGMPFPTDELDEFFEQKVEHATRNVKSTRRRSLIVKNVANAQRRWQKNFLKQVKEHFEKLDDKNAELERARILTDDNVYELSNRIDANAEFVHDDIKHLTEGAKNINERLRKIESEQRELEAIMNEAVSKPLVGEADYSDVDDSTSETLNLLNEKYNSLDKRFKDWWQIFNTNLKQANENKKAMDNMKNDIHL